MVGIDRKQAGFIVALILVLLVALWSVSVLYHALSPVRVGVLLPISANSDIREPLEWAKENINREGGIGGRPLELVCRDTSVGNIQRVAKEFLDDPTIQVVIGPYSTDEVFKIAPSFIERKKILISPSACGGDVIRAFGKTGYFWRTMQGDVEQVRAMTGILKEQKVRRIALLVENSTNGDTFYSWTGFFATESGLTLTDIRQFEPGERDLEDKVRDTLATDPEVVIVLATPGDTSRIWRTMKQSKNPARLFVADLSDSASLTRLLGEESEGIMGIQVASDPTTGFSVAFDEKFHHAPDGYAAPVYDAVILAAYTAARQDSAWFESPADSIRAVIYGKETGYDWDAQGVRQTLQAILQGKRPEVWGASGPLDYDREYGVDPLVAYYGYGVIEEGAFRISRIISSEKTGSIQREGVSAARFQASKELMALPVEGSAQYTPPARKTGFYAVVVGPSKGWWNYRHQSDALAIYTLLKNNGVPDDRIILMIYDDIPSLSENPIKGDIHNVPKGENLRAGAEVDYAGPVVTAETLHNVLLGNRTMATPVVLESNSTTDIFVYIASHGAPGATVYAGEGSDPLTSEKFADLVATMDEQGKYRQIVLFVDTCFGESMAKNITAKGVIYFTAAAVSETSMADVYDIDIHMWLSDQFTATALAAIRENPDITFRELYITTYERVTGSHVRMLNAENFGDIDIPVRDFVRP